MLMVDDSNESWCRISLSSEQCVEVNASLKDDIFCCSFFGKHYFQIVSGLMLLVSGSTDHILCNILYIHIWDLF